MAIRRWHRVGMSMLTAVLIDYHIEMCDHLLCQEKSLCSNLEGENSGSVLFGAFVSRM